MGSDSEKVQITMADGEKRECEVGITPGRLLESDGDVLVAEVNGQLTDLSRPIQEDASLKRVTFEEEAGNWFLLDSTKSSWACSGEPERSILAG